MVEPLDSNCINPVAQPSLSGFYKLNALTRKAAICARVTVLFGQYKGGLTPHPIVIWRRDISSMCAEKGFAGGTSWKRCEAGCGGM
jgi:hypothetical protein